MFKKSALAIGVLVVLSGCASSPDKICTPDTSVPIATSDSPMKLNENRKVIVLPVDVNFNDAAKSKLQTVFRNELENQIATTGTQLVDRKLAAKLTNEIKLAEQSGRFNTKGVPIADFAIITEVTNSDLSYSFDEAYSYENKKGKTIKVPAECNFKVDVAATVKIVKLPEMQVVKRIELTGGKSASTENRNSNCPVSNSSYKSWAAKAAKESVLYNPELRKMLSPRAPVLELRQCDVGSMVKIGVGSDRNIKPSDGITFSKIMKNSDGELESFSAGTGTVVDVPVHGIKPKYSWVSIDDKTAIGIQKGDEAQVVQETCSTWDLKCWSNNISGYGI